MAIDPKEKIEDICNQIWSKGNKLKLHKELASCLSNDFGFCDIEEHDTRFFRRRNSGSIDCIFPTGVYFTNPLNKYVNNLTYSTIFLKLDPKDEERFFGSWDKIEIYSRKEGVPKVFSTITFFATLGAMCYFTDLNTDLNYMINICVAGVVSQLPYIPNSVINHNIRSSKKRIISILEDKNTLVSNREYDASTILWAVDNIDTSNRQRYLV